MYTTRLGMILKGIAITIRLIKTISQTVDYSCLQFRKEYKISLKYL